MKLALAQMKMMESIEDNFQKTIQLIEEAAFHQAQIICFPELQLTPFFPQYPHQNVGKYVSHINDLYIQGICQACFKNQIFVAINVYIAQNNKYYDMSLLIDKNGSYCTS